jgi:PPOX class probable FMN-dependent enzyme
MPAGYIESVEDLRRLFDGPRERSVKKQLSELDQHCRRFIELSPFVVIATGDGHRLDSSPRGGAPGFVRAVDEKTLWIPDSPGNNRLDSLINIVATGRIGLLFLIPGVDETLRVNGAARVSDDSVKVSQLATEKRTPKVVIEVTVEEAYLHCAKALMRSRLWAEESRQDRGVLPTLGEMLADQTRIESKPETQAEMMARYGRDL